MTPLKDLLLEYDNLKRQISKNFQRLSVFDTQEHVKLIIDGIRCFIYSALYCGIPIESVKEKFKLEVMVRINKFLQTYKDDITKNEKKKDLMSWVSTNE